MFGPVMLSGRKLVVLSFDTKTVTPASPEPLSFPCHSTSKLPDAWLASTFTWVMGGSLSTVCFTTFVVIGGLKSKYTFAWVCIVVLLARFAFWAMEYLTQPCPSGGLLSGGREMFLKKNVICLPAPSIVTFSSLSG